MKTGKLAALRPVKGIARHLAGALVATSVLTMSAPETTAEPGDGLPPFVVDNDRGGFIRDRLIELRNLRASGQKVEIRGRICYSTCTMFLGLPQTCISPKTVFGFHGPSRNGYRMQSRDFEYYSQVIAQYYPQELRSWYMKKGRTRIRGVYRIRGEQIIRMGIQSCKSASLWPPVRGRTGLRSG